MLKGGHGQTKKKQNSYLTVIVVQSTMHLMHHNHRQITIIIILLYMYCIRQAWVRGCLLGMPTMIYCILYEDHQNLITFVKCNSEKNVCT